jgi:hypothetical protein
LLRSDVLSIAAALAPLSGSAVPAVSASTSRQHVDLLPLFRRLLDNLKRAPELEQERCFEALANYLPPVLRYIQSCPDRARVTGSAARLLLDTAVSAAEHDVAQCEPLTLCDLRRSEAQGGEADRTSGTASDSKAGDGHHTRRRSHASDSDRGRDSGIDGVRSTQRTGTNRTCRDDSGIVACGGPMKCCINSNYLPALRSSPASACMQRRAPPPAPLLPVDLQT